MTCRVNGHPDSLRKLESAKSKQKIEEPWTRIDTVEA
eukprot:CAMPEP_0171902256 /NCGR_PEP_ID=MMETSP0993-20121228/1389_1 /TAXON_ID=483369 /ORGANISM="non described non described, Strain CCMP2098" /LENGTH=36 /DNA_ID= /DNA_START= /DNA_END= /DNA_ORIENTATION=